MMSDKRCLWCTNNNGKTDLNFSVIDDDFGQYAPMWLIKYCPFCGRESPKECE